MFCVQGQARWQLPAKEGVSSHWTHHTGTSCPELCKEGKSRPHPSSLLEHLLDKGTDGLETDFDTKPCQPHLILGLILYILTACIHCTSVLLYEEIVALRL